MSVRQYNNNKIISMIPTATRKIVNSTGLENTWAFPLVYYLPPGKLPNTLCP